MEEEEGGEEEEGEEARLFLRRYQDDVTHQLVCCLGKRSVKPDFIFLSLLEII